MWSHGSFYWNELMTWNVEKAKAFYGATLGWTFEPMATGNETYWIAKADDKPVGGIFPLSEKQQGAPESWLPYVAVDDLDGRLQKARTGGGTVMREPFDVPDVGRIAILTDANGAPVGWITPVGR